MPASCFEAGYLTGIQIRSAIPALVSVCRRPDPLINPIITAANARYRAPITFCTLASLLIFKTVDGLVDAAGGIWVDLALAYLMPKAAL